MHIPQESICLSFTNNQKYLPSLKLLKKKKKWDGFTDDAAVYWEEGNPIAFRGTCYIFSLALFYLHNLGLLILFLFCVDNCFVVSALTVSDSAFGWLTAKSIGRRSSSYTERCFLSA